MINIKENEFQIEFWFTNGISYSDLEELQHLLPGDLEEGEVSVMEFVIDDRLNKNHYIYYKDTKVIGVDRLDNYGE